MILIKAVIGLGILLVALVIAVLFKLVIIVSHKPKLPIIDEDLENLQIMLEDKECQCEECLDKDNPYP